MIKKRLSPLTAAIAAAGLFLPQQAEALTAIGQPSAFSIHESRVNAVQPIGTHQMHNYHGAKCGYRHGQVRSHCRSRSKSSYHRPQQKSGYSKPWQGHEPCANCPSVK
jgi:hypothetical protein